MTFLPFMHPREKSNPLPQEPMTTITKSCRKPKKGETPSNIVVPDILPRHPKHGIKHNLYQQTLFACYPPKGEPRVSNGLLIATL